MAKLRQYLQPLIILIIFETVAVTLWLTKNNLFYLFNFSYIGLSISLGIFLFINKYKYARRIVQLLVGLYMLVYLGLICRENMQIEGFWYYLLSGVFEAATIHYAVAKIFGGDSSEIQRLSESRSRAGKRQKGLSGMGKAAKANEKNRRRQGACKTNHGGLANTL